MKRKMALLAMVLMMSMTGVSLNKMDTLAQENVPTEHDYSYLETADTIIGRMEVQPRGVYLLEGMSTIQDAGIGKIIAGGITTATRQCKVTLNVIVERLEEGRWYRVTSWTTSLANDWTVGSSKLLSVGRGYYYRVRCLHSANSDASSSMTSSMWR